MAKVAGLNQWVNRATRAFIQQTSSGEMERLFPGEVLHDISGEPTSNANWIHAPDLSAVVGFRNIYWIITGDVVSLMSPPERNAVDAAAQSARRDAQVENDLDGLESTLRQIVKLVMSELNILRQLHGLPDRTLSQLRNALRGGYGN